MPAKLRVALVLLLGIGGILIYYVYNGRTTNGSLRASGTIETTKVDVSFQVGGRVADISVREGDAIESGEVLAHLSSDEIQARIHQIQASLEAVHSQIAQQQAIVEMRQESVEHQISQARNQADAARIVVEKLKEGSRPQEIRVAEAAVAQADAELERRRNDFDRMKALFDRQVISRSELDAFRSGHLMAESNLTAAKERLALAKEGARKEDVAEAEARSRAAESGVRIAESGRRDVDVQKQALATLRARQRELEAQMEAVRTQLAYTEIRSPIRGVVLLKNIEGGEVVNPGTPVVTIGDLANVWMNLYIPETQTGLVQLGQQVHIRVDSFPGTDFVGKITFISSESEFTPKTIQTEEERVKLVYRVKVSIDNSDQRLKPGMPADAEIIAP